MISPAALASDQADDQTVQIGHKGLLSDIQIE